MKQISELVLQDSNGKTALMYAVFYLNTEIVKVLLQAGADVNRQDSVWEKTALMHAASLDKTEIVTEVIKLLLQAGADVNGQDSNGKTALMYAVFYLNAEVVKLLLNSGANVNARDNQYRTALTIAYRAHDKRGFLDNMLVKKDYKNTVQALKQAGATE